jgi:2-oxoglutarate dehydrogenase complex dehydrogenase (E1) component-like enzyme
MKQFLLRTFAHQIWGKNVFSLEGGESIIPALDTLIERAAEMGVEQFVMEWHIVAV